MTDKPTPFDWDELRKITAATAAAQARRTVAEIARPNPLLRFLGERRKPLTRWDRLKSWSGYYRLRQRLANA